VNPVPATQGFSHALTDFDRQIGDKPEKSTTVSTLQQKIGVFHRDIPSSSKCPMAVQWLDFHTINLLDHFPLPSMPDDLFFPRTPGPLQCG
jgi:hypothetical protein